MKKNKKLAIVGYHDGSAGQINSWINEQGDFKVEMFCVGETDNFSYPNPNLENKKKGVKNTSYPNKKKFEDRLFIDHKNWVDEIVNNKIKYVICLNPINTLRSNEIKLCKKKGLNLINIIHPSVKCMKNVNIESGIWINANSFIGYKSKISEGTIINSSCSIDHHNFIDKCVQIDPGVVTAGNVTIKKFSHIHTGATIINKIIIGENTQVSAGSVVFKNTKKNRLYFGNPAKSYLKK